MDQLIENIDKSKLPCHVAVIMDGNGRWAQSQGKNRVFGHKNGVKSVREISEAAAELGIEYLTLYAFSAENWNRPKLEVAALMKLLVETLHKEVSTLNKNNIRLQAIGKLEDLPFVTYKALMKGIKDTQHNTGMTLTLALNYSSREEIVDATKSVIKALASGHITEDDITTELLSNHLYTADFPDPELLIRTSGEERISNFLLWQLAYTEFYFTDVFWPEFGKEHFYKALEEYQSRERRFGMTGDQLKA